MLSGFSWLVEFTLGPDWHATLKWPGFPHLLQVTGRAPLLLLLAAGSVSVVVAECACGSLVGLSAAPSRGAFVAFWVVPAFLEFYALAFVVVNQLVCGPIWLLLGPGDLSLALFCALFCLNELFNCSRGEKALS